MSLKGEIQANHDALEDLFEAVVMTLAGESSQLAVWVLDDQLNFSQMKAQRIGASSPFSESNSILAGSGLLIKLTMENVQKLLPLFRENDYLGYQILHLQIESQGSVQFAAYDHFYVVFFGDLISLEMLERLKQRDIIQDYSIP
ncbi:hypothetical protein PCC9214_03323 [Planktothrix tepida]|uniref:Uncharacterized protein n=2 Tax=Planktothrix TaxID=54304 RepID=A0A1J1LQL3_9CYAN|nr:MULTISPECIES: hypothetical protein [Planktothrix]CAD5947434.1 hypothetical protein NO713_02330 [Planktothrix pseudagardhii]CAD5963189.1 hypothetical protein PCC9214_03323 [Planktothrix tepida]CUR34872.1 conserved hypothetical protein [Planktothrix tepida PCC 9214]